jgi:hypothetical protein
VSQAVTFALEGRTEFDAAIDAWVARIEIATQAGLKAATEEVKKESAASFGSVGGPQRGASGKLEEAVTGTEPKKGGLSEYETTVGPTGLAYIRRVELGKAGAHSAKAHPYFQPGYERASLRFLEVFVKSWGEAQPK